MSTLQRYDLCCDGGATRPEREKTRDGKYVRFADVEPLLADQRRLEWLMPLMTGEDDRVSNARTQALAAGILLGKSGRDLIDFAAEGSP